jgi:hypothetical protein
MPDTSEGLQSQIDRLNTARANGASVVTYLANGASRSVTYKSDREMNAAVQDLQRRLAALQAGARRVTYVDTSKGLRSTREFLR